MPASLYRQVLQDRQDLFNQALDAGVYTPFLYPWDTLPVLFLLSGVVFVPKLPDLAARLSRYVLTLLSLGYIVARWPYARTVGLTAGYGIGLAGCWGLIMTVVLLVLHDPGKDFRRIEVRKSKSTGSLEGKATDANSQGISFANGSTRKRIGIDTVPLDSIGGSSRATTEDTQTELVWQDRPREFWHLLDWSIDLLISFRGINWNWRIPVTAYLYDINPPEGDPPQLASKAQRANHGAFLRLQRSSILRFLLYYLTVDLVKTVCVTDPYFLGIAPLEAPSPWPWLASVNEVIPFATKFIRLSLSIGSCVTALTFIFSLNPLFFGIVLPYLLGDKLYTVTKAPLLEVWMYPPQWGGMMASLCNKGLGGMWSTWWHQMFRYGISEPSRLLVAKLKMNPRGQFARVLQLGIAFSLTAAIHAAASSTTFSVIPSMPSHSAIFFLGQAAGILVQTELSRRLNQLMRFPKLVRQTGNFTFAFIFMWYIGPFLSDDFARCQIWLFEPVPVSVFRGLGFGTADCWIPWLQFPEGGRWVGWWKGEHWYSSGIGIF